MKKRKLIKKNQRNNLRMNLVKLMMLLKKKIMSQRKRGIMPQMKRKRKKSKDKV